MLFPWFSGDVGVAFAITAGGGPPVDPWKPTAAAAT